jgi:two-component system cell cycle response regulator DivK
VVGLGIQSNLEHSIEPRHRNARHGEGLEKESRGSTHVEYFVIDSAASPPVRNSHHKPVVLLVDDYDDAREMYAEYLKFSGFETVQAASGPEAVRRALESRPDIVVMDLSLPVMDGWEATRRLKADERTATIPILALTGHVFTNLSQKAKLAGFDGFVAKPCLPEDLIAEIRKVLDASTSPDHPVCD